MLLIYLPSVRIDAVLLVKSLTVIFNDIESQIHGVENLKQDSLIALHQLLDTLSIQHAAQQHGIFLIAA